MLLARVGIIEPGRGCIVTQSVTAPVEIAIVSRPRAVVHFERERRVQDCVSAREGI
jgi:hypothetical protein